nr:hypothetical protein [Tanacetum cinerariifolium]
MRCNDKVWRRVTGGELPRNFAWEIADNGSVKSVFKAWEQRLSSFEYADVAGYLVKNADLLVQTEVLQDQPKVKHVVIDTHTECQAQYAKL